MQLFYQFFKYTLSEKLSGKGDLLLFCWKKIKSIATQRALSTWNTVK